ncbi:Rossmann-like and DUF2520 domain-containing protein [Microbulbifer sp.]|uniref:Rossmann-like and DUF2520 domain-containing protein n=1 Tax=Microbulbifer sp. TaxID=1908541 RepID=UPI00258A004F|nr:Rossmann-like and DUF2520 domain-containing protein [Microbulbifer sp.]
MPPPIPLSLNIIGAGRLGKTLGRLWHRRHSFEISGICNQTLQSARAAQTFIGAGEACASLADLPAADCWLIATADDQIEDVARQLGPLLPTDRTTPPMVFHCSGALPAAALADCAPAQIASAHPVHSFAEPAQSLETFTGSTVALEGDSGACEQLRQAFVQLGCKTLTLTAPQKVLYHSGSVIACNYLTALMDLSLQAFSGAGIDEKTARELLEPIVLQTARNNFALGPGRALTGPIARGDSETVRKQLDALTALRPLLADNYRALGLAAVDLAQRTGLTNAQAQRLQAVLNQPSK